MATLDNAMKRRLDTQFAAIRSLNPSRLIAEGERYRYTIERVQTGGFIRFNGKTHRIEAVGRYQEADESFEHTTDNEWFELRLFCLETGETVYLEWEKDDEVEISITTDTLKFSELRDDEGESIDDDDLDQIADEKEDIVYRGQTFSYEDDYAATYYGDDDKEGERAYFYDFVARDKTLTIEEWVVDLERDKYDYRIYLSENIDPDAIEVLAVGGKKDGQKSGLR
ncbi:MAG: DUF4178 domain-containing protein [Candidatus Bipolaricaulia bacterium]